ncbi:MAG: hypothetical protein A3D65_06940 [Candidatus Lloydbacteria bacterium RIFCSPHIGHO2_02_FULL_50_13]|uniref:Uncharacterized protein n=1 Tax=Candidatus Lloydbacteria bacterium RIFCSPHIGHO2_02_FULL_50_13 TaxID=1798661 RepID=A0A1G2D9G4_9BACT|nr:MAG: hypothetical protein A3D65_06940 [Candidatus Lloydbacteria bacterium RIFCSPHIGHO2_02_FULL_50_13]
MPYVELYKLQNDGSQKVVATCRLDGDAVRCEGDTVLVNNLMTGGIKDYDNPDETTLFFKDGLKFLEQLKFNFTSGYLNASEVKE